MRSRRLCAEANTFDDRILLFVRLALSIDTVQLSFVSNILRNDKLCETCMYTAERVWVISIDGETTVYEKKHPCS
jgi:hypothetical protein